MWIIIKNEKGRYIPTKTNQSMIGGLPSKIKARKAIRIIKVTMKRDKNEVQLMRRAV